MEAQQDGQMTWADVTLQRRFPFLVWHNAHFMVRFPGW
jgi:hypothetical protein